MLSLDNVVSSVYPRYVYPHTAQHHPHLKVAAALATVPTLRVALMTKYRARKAMVTA